MTATSAKPLQFQLMFRKEAKAYQRPKVGKNWGNAPEEGGEQWGERDMARFKSLPETPEGFTDLTDSFPVVSSRADFLNNQQMNAGFVEFFFWAEATPVDYNRTHCDACKRIAVRDASE